MGNERESSTRYALSFSVGVGVRRKQGIGLRM